MKQVLTALLIFAWCPSAAIAAKDSFEEIIKPIFQQNCVKCHGENGKVKGKLNLLEIKSRDQLLEDAERIERIMIAIEDGDMPPEKEPPLSVKKRDLLTSRLDEELKKALEQNTVEARTAIRRMNRFQYANAVKDLLDLKVSVFPLPERMMRDRSGYFAVGMKGKMPDSMLVSSRPLGKSGLIEPRLSGVGPFPQDLRAEHGYDNRADHLSLSPILMEAFFKLSRTIVKSSTFSPKTVGICKGFIQAPPPE